MMPVTGINNGKTIKTAIPLLKKIRGLEDVESINCGEIVKSSIEEASIRCFSTSNGLKIIVQGQKQEQVFYVVTRNPAVVKKAAGIQ